MVSRKSASVKSKNVLIRKGKSKKTIKKKSNTAMPVTLPNPTAEVEVKKEVKSLFKKKITYTLPSKVITESAIDLALQALNKLMAQQNNKNIIFGDETSIFLELRCIKIPSISRASLRFVLPHSTIASSNEVCLITADLKKGKRFDHEPTIEHWEEQLRKAGITEVKTILPMRQLRVEYDQFELKRRLLTQHDFIMVDCRVLKHVSHLLGKMFFKKHNMVVPVKIDQKGVTKDDIDVGLRTSILRLSEGDTSSFLIGHTGMPQHNIKENILGFVSQLNARFPGGEHNIRSISIKLPLSISVPLYITLRPSNSIIGIPKVIKNKPKHFVEVEDELSTIPGSTVRVAPDGTVLLRKPRKGNDERNEEDNDDTDMENKNDA